MWLIYQTQYYNHILHNTKQRHLKIETQFHRVFFNHMNYTFCCTKKLYTFVMWAMTTIVKGLIPKQFFLVVFFNSFPIEWTSVLLYYYLRIEMNKGVSFIESSFIAFCLFILWNHPSHWLKFSNDIWIIDKEDVVCLDKNQQTNNSFCKKMLNIFIFWLWSFMIVFDKIKNILY